MSPLDCYELCVQSPRHVTRLLRHLHARAQPGFDPQAPTLDDSGASWPVVLREDFAGTAAVSRRWVSEAHARGLSARSIAIDSHEPTLQHAREQAHAAGVPDHIEFIRDDAVAAPVQPRDACDVIFVGNFSIGYIHDRRDLVAYLSRSRQRLALGNAGFGGGVFVCDIYDSPNKYTLGMVHRRHPSRGRELIHYTWEHRSADVLTAMVQNAIHFRIEVDGIIEHEMFDAFVYNWRLWSLVELRDAMHEAGFSCVEVFAEVSDGPKPIITGADLPESGVVCLCASSREPER